MPTNNYKSVALNIESYKKLQSIASSNNRAKNRELAGLIDTKYDEVFDRNKKSTNNIILKQKKTNDEFLKDLVLLINKYEYINKNNSAFITKTLITVGIDRLFEISSPNPLLAVSCLLMAIEAKVDHLSGLKLEDIRNVN
tara:strand:+ start:2387 stop:2806 length:420 start_codon:yes stop_codon:yes gene_type:complete